MTTQAGPAIASLFIPGLGQACQGRQMTAVFHFVAACFLWLFLLGWVVNLCSAFGAAAWKERAQ